jgi:osmoprotectant transport system permease protein
MISRAARVLVLLAACATAPGAFAADKVVVGSKRFTESYILGEIVRLTLQDAGIPAEHKQGLGNTGILEQALATGAVDVYPEYTGTIVRELLKREGNPTLAELNTWLAPRGLKVAVPLGFNNTYALAMREAQAERLGIRTLSDLTRPEAASLRMGLSHEFLARTDGWPALKAAYKLPFAPPAGIDHGIAYDAIAAERVDVIDIYSTDAKVGRYKLRVLVDDRGFFPKYDAVLLMRASLDPAPLAKLAGRIDEKTMIALNAQVELDGATFAEAAQRFVSGRAAPATKAPAGFMQRLFADDFARLAGQHLALVFGSLVIAIAVGVPLGIAAWRWPPSSGLLLGAVGVLQTVPSIALLAFLIALVGGIGLLPAVIALFLYALLPIVRNTHTGLTGVPTGLAHAALSLGLTPRQCLRHVQLPLAMPTVLAGVKTAAVINVGTATVAAFIGAGGFGERIVAGLAVNDTAAMLAGALPAAVLALLVQMVFDGIERWRYGHTRVR